MGSFIFNSLNSTLEPPIIHHLKNVYACLVMSNLAAALGASIQIFTDVPEASRSTLLLLSIIGEMLLFFLLVLFPDNEGRYIIKRVGYLCCFSVLSGFNLGPLIQVVTLIDRSILVNSFLATSGIFLSFTICALFSKTGEWLFLGAILVTFWEFLIVVSMANIIFGSTLLWEVDVYLKLFILCGFILYETQAIVEKRRTGSQDVAAHSLNLFVSVFGIFKNILVILSREISEARNIRNAE